MDNLDNSKPSAVVVMMNPGSSKPLDRDYIPRKFSPDEITSSSWIKEMIPSKADNAQYQIMRMMLLKRWKHVRILNLSDLRNGNSGDFSIEYENAELLDPSNPHSLIHEGRFAELSKYCAESDLVIAAWGSNEVLRKAALSFLSIFNNVRGLPLDKPWYRYPSPYKKDQKIAWLESMNKELKHLSVSVKIATTFHSEQPQNRPVFTMKNATNL